jgi:hypothetical protein
MKKLYDIVLHLLTINPEFRNSDKRLIWEVWCYQGKAFAGFMSRENFMMAATPESITRARRKIQEIRIDLGPTAETKSRRSKIAKQKGTQIFRTTLF